MSRVSAARGAAVVLVVAALALAGVASAATLSVTSRTLDPFAVVHPCPAQVPVSPVTSGTTFSAVTVTVPAACADRLVRVAVRTATATLEASSTVTGTTQTVTFTGSADAGAVVAVDATVGGWSLPVRWSYTPAPVTVGCVVVNPAGNPVGNRTCTVTGLTVTWWTEGNGVRKANFYASFSPTGLSSSQRIRFTIDLASAPGLPANWGWATSATTTTGNYTPAPGFACSSLPALTGFTATGWGSYTNVYMPLTESRATATGVTCT